MERFADRLNKAMQIRGMKQVDLVNTTRIQKSVISEYVNGKFEPKQDNLYLIAKALDVKEAWLMGYQGVSMGRHDNDHLERFGDDPVDIEALKFISEVLSTTMIRWGEDFDSLFFRVLAGLDFLNEDGFEKVIDYIQTLSRDERYGSLSDSNEVISHDLFKAKMEEMELKYLNKYKKKIE